MSHEDPPGGHPYQPYGAPYGQQPPPGYGHPHGAPRPNPEGPRAAAIVALVLNLLAVTSCCNLLAIPGAILAGKALGCSATEPERSRSMLTSSWILFGAGFVLTVGLFLFLGLTGRLDD
jgi:hypothetical protein